MSPIYTRIKTIIKIFHRHKWTTVAHDMSHDALEELEAAISQLEVAIKLHENIGDFVK